MGRKGEEPQREEDFKHAGKSSEIKMGAESSGDESRSKSRREVLKSTHRVEC